MSEPEESPDIMTPVEQTQLHHPVNSSTKIATTGATPAAVFLSMITVWLHAFIRVFAWLHCDAGMNGIVVKTELHPMNLSRLIVSCCRLFGQVYPTTVPKMPVLVDLLEPLGEGKPVPVFEREPFMTDQRLITVTILSDSSLLFLDDEKTTKKKKGYVRDDEIKENLQRMLPYRFNLRIRGGAPATEYVDEMRD